MMPWSRDTPPRARSAGRRAPRRLGVRLGASGGRTAGEAPRGGFTLLEVMLAMGVLTLGMSAILGLLTFGAALTRSAALRASSAAALEAVLADLEESLFPLEEDGRVGEPRTFEDRPVPGALGVRYSARATPNPQGPTTPHGDPLEYRVDLTVAFEAGGVERTRTYTTLLLREVPFGERMRRRFVSGGALPPEEPPARGTEDER